MSTLADVINGSFEALASVAVLHHCAVVWHDRRVAGVSVPAVAFFTVWGFWNLYYYPLLGQFFSTVGGVMVTLANLSYLALLWRFRRQGG